VEGAVTSGRRRSGILGVALAALGAGAGAAAVRFEDVAAEWGIEFRHRHGGQGDFYLIETMGSGCLIFDADGDGDADLLLVDSGALAPGGDDRRLRFYRNDGRRFVDRTAAAGLGLASYGMGAAAGDVDGDGDLDLYLTAYGPNLLLINRGDGTFEDAGAAAAVDDPSWSASAAFADPDGDGDLDLYVANYVEFSFDTNPTCGDQERNLRSYCHPKYYTGAADRYYRNRGDGTFEEVAAGVGLAPPPGRGLGVVFGDLDRDGRDDLYVANDMTPNFLFHNRGDGTFEEIALESGVAIGGTGEPEAGMGVDLGDLDGDGWPEIMVTNFDDETNALYSASDLGLFTDRRFPAQIAKPSMLRLGFGVLFADLDQDADLDIAVANGHIIHNVEEWQRTPTTYRQPNQLLVNDGQGGFEEVAAGWDRVGSSRGLAAGDLDGDGALDLVFTNSNDSVEVYRNATSPRGGYLQADLRRPAGNRFAIGARVELVAGGRSQWREVKTGASYLSQSSLTLHFGLAAAPAGSLRVDWPGGGARVYRGLPASRRLLLAE